MFQCGPAYAGMARSLVAQRPRIRCARDSKLDTPDTALERADGPHGPPDAAKHSAEVE
ncbi:hypothetical protein TRAPUB_2524 [Trametes pubescens]|uniref:Uncharacterized protein n=1 Tax=Trametes pubescens TaxID=154538 RepID=A0A1M2VGA4_TRAPU|nr:hypothetical protein TRAPUB_2524 [Trametes pubescens]